MIRYAYDRKLGHVYYELMPGGELREVEPRVVLAALNAKQPALVDQPAAHWSPWLEWRGGPCPLPGDTLVEPKFRNGESGDAHPAYAWGTWTRTVKQYGSDIIRFRYRSPDPAGWLPRGDWIPPAELWAPECPVRCEWMDRNRGSVAITSPHPPIPDRATHIRLVARQPQAGLPEGWKRTRHGDLVSPSGRMIFARENVDQYGGGDVIRQAVDAWLREMGDE